MAIKINKVKRSRASLGRIIMILIILSIVAATVYFLFFAPTPGFQYIAPAPLERNQALSNFDLNPDVVFSSPEFKTLELYQIDMGVGTFGRQNPFSRP